jgi:hypothetical protein
MDLATTDRGSGVDDVDDRAEWSDYADELIEAMIHRQGRVDQRL